MRSESSHAAKSWLIRGRRIELSKPVVMGILNVTPDSFSDGGRAVTVTSAVDQALRMVEDGATIIDIGGESTRPGAEAVQADMEISRTEPVIKELRRQSNIPISIDTTKSQVARAALDSGADIVNDISAGRFDERMRELVADTDAGYVIMHMQGTPRDMQKNPYYDNVVSEVSEFLQRQIQVCIDSGIDSDSIVVDPGIGFGKTLEHNLALLNSISEFTGLNAPVLVGVSRKSFIAKLSDPESAPDQRLGGSIAAALIAVMQGARIVRAHDVRDTVEAFKVYSALTETTSKLSREKI